MKKTNYVVAALVVSVLSLGAPEESSAQANTIPVQIINPPDLPVPVIRTDDLPIPPELSNFQRQYCARWRGPFELQENRSRRLVEYRARIPTINFPNRVFWVGELLGNLVASEERTTIGWQGAVEVASACAVSVPPGFVPSFFPNLVTATRNLYRISDEVQGYACVFDEKYPVDVLVRARILEFSGTSSRDVEIVPPSGDNRVCLDLTFIGPVPAD